MIQSSKPIPTYTLLNPVTYSEHGIPNIVYMPQIFHFSDELRFNGAYNLWKMIGLSYNTKTYQ